MPAGRPPLYDSPEKMQKDIDAYFAKCKDESRPYTMSGLALALGMSRQSLVNYSEKTEFFDTIKKARQIVETFLEESLHGGSVTGIIFNLKNNFQWKDKQEVEQTGKAPVINIIAGSSDDKI